MLAMIQRVGNTIVMFLLVIILIATGCSGKTQEYFNSAKEFNNIYFQVVDQVELNNNMKSLKSLQSEDEYAVIERAC
jgi:LPS sulfotransferase NodH